MARHHTIAVDLDGTLLTDSWPYLGTPMPGAIEAMQELQKIANPVIFTCRIAPMEIDGFTPRPAAVVQMEKDKIQHILESHGLRNIPIWDKPWKPLAAAYVDNRAVRYSGRTNSWDVALQQIRALLYKADKGKNA